MLKLIFERAFDEPVSDVVWHGERAFVASGASLVVLERGDVKRRFDVAVESLVVSEDGRALLGVAPRPNRPANFPLRQPGPPEFYLRTRRVYRLAAPWEACADLGVASIEGWCRTFDGRHWVTYDGDFVDVHECAGAQLERRGRFEACDPLSIEQVRGGVWVETSSFGARHFVALSVPDLSVLVRGDLPRCAIEFPSEITSYHSQAPTLAQPIFAVVAAGLPVSQKEGQAERHANNDVHRVVTLDGRTVTTLPAPSAGLAASSERALFWCEAGAGLEFVLICLRTGRLKSRFTLAGATQGGGRLFGRDLVAWVGGSVRVFRDVGDA